MTQVVTGVEGIANLVQTTLKKHGLPADQNMVALYVNKAKVESNLGELNSASGNGAVAGTWQMDPANVESGNPGNVIDKMAKGEYSESILPKEVQQKMAATYKAIRSSNEGSDTATLQNQEACLIASIALQAENEQIYKNKGVDVANILKQKPELTFPVRYFMHQLPPTEGAAMVQAMAKNPNANIRDILPNNIISSNPATYEGMTTVQEVITNLNKRYEVMKSGPVATAAAGITAPSNESLSAIIVDMEANGLKPTADGLRAIEQEYIAKGNLSEERKTEIAKQLGNLQANIHNLYKANGIAILPETEMLSQHLGPFSAAVLLKSDDKTKLSEASVTINGKPTSITPQALEIFKKEIGAGADIDTVGELKTAAKAFYDKQQGVAQDLATRKKEGTLNETEKKETDFFDQITQAMQKEGGFLGLIFGLMTMMMQQNEQNETERTNELIQPIKDAQNNRDNIPIWAGKVKDIKNTNVTSDNIPIGNTPIVPPKTPVTTPLNNSPDIYVR